MEDLCICRVSIKSIPKILAAQQNQFHMEITHDMLVCENHDPDFMKTIITGERQGFMFTTQKPSSSPLNKNNPKKPDMFPSNVKVMTTCFFDSCVIVHHEICTTRLNNNKYYLWGGGGVIGWLCDAVHQKWLDMCMAKNWQLNHSVSTHSSHPPNPRFLGQEQQTTFLTVSLLFQFGTMWPLVLPRSKNHAENEPILIARGNYEKYGGRAL